MLMLSLGVVISDFMRLCSNLFLTAWRAGKHCCACQRRGQGGKSNKRRMLQKQSGAACLLWLIGQLLTVSMAAKTEVQALRLWPSPDSTRVVLDLSAAVDYHVFSLHHPERVVVDMESSRLLASLQQLPLQDTVVQQIRHGENKGDLRLVLDLKEPVLTSSFTLKPNEQYGHRLVLDLNKKEDIAQRLQPVRQADWLQERDFIIAIDPGHGGEDPGAIGRKGTREKNVVLQIGKKLQRQVSKQAGMKAILIRDGDYYVGLRQRMQRARKKQADLFVSVHADAFRDGRAKGASIYTLSTHGASNEAARWLADRENRADLIGGVSLDDKDDVLASVLLDLSQTASSEASLQVAKAVLYRLGGIARLHSAKVQQAGFAVLKSPDIPSILVETGFISNSQEEKSLRSEAYQQKLAYAIAHGMREYLADKPRPKVSSRVADYIDSGYRVSRGDTLATLASRYGTTVHELQNRNQLQTDRLFIGQTLHLPAPQPS